MSQFTRAFALVSIFLCLSPAVNAAATGSGKSGKRSQNQNQNQDQNQGQNQGQPPLENGPTSPPPVPQDSSTQRTGGNTGNNGGMGGMGGMMGGMGRMGGGMGGASTAMAIVNLGNLAWTIIQANQPSDTAAVASANALPQGVKGWQELTGWEEPVIKDFEKDFPGVISSDPVTVKYRVHYTYGGSLDGKGKYLTDISVEPVDIHVGWGYKLTMTASVPNIVNMGTDAEPLAAAELLIDMKVTSIFKSEEVSVDYEIKGDGSIQDLTAGGQQ